MREHVAHRGAYKRLETDAELQQRARGEAGHTIAYGCCLKTLHVPNGLAGDNTMDNLARCHGVTRRIVEVMPADPVPR